MAVEEEDPLREGVVVVDDELEEGRGLAGHVVRDRMPHCVHTDAAAFGFSRHTFRS